MNIDITKQTVYRISPLKLWLVPGILVAIAIFMLALRVLSTDIPENTRDFPIYIGAFFLAFAAVMYFILRRIRLVLSAKGITLRQFGYSLETNWENIAYLYDEPGRQGLVLHRPTECVGAHTLSGHRNRRVNGVNFFSDEQIQFMVELRFIPIDAFAYWLKKGQLRDDLIRRAPTLKN